MPHWRRSDAITHAPLNRSTPLTIARSPSRRIRADPHQFGCVHEAIGKDLVGHDARAGNCREQGRHLCLNIGRKSREGEGDAIDGPQVALRSHFHRVVTYKNPDTDLA